MLSRLQIELLGVVADLDPGGAFALAGAGALLAHGAIDRPTADLDLFATAAAPVEELGPRLVEDLARRGWGVTELRREPGFLRLAVDAHGDRCLIDLAYDARLRPPVPNPVGPGLTLDLEEVAGDKVLALFDRTLPRDFTDAHRLAEVLGRDRLLELAAAKDDGFRIGYFVEALDRFHRLRPDEFGLDEDGYAELSRFVSEWRSELEPPTVVAPGDGLDPFD